MPSVNQQQLPALGGNNNTWGQYLNGFLSQSLNIYGFLTTVSVQTSNYTINNGNFTYSSTSPYTGSYPDLPNTGSNGPGSSGQVWTGETVLVNAVSSNVTITLPAVPTGSGGFYNPIHTIKRIDNNYPTYTVTITPTGATIDGSSSSISLNVQYASITLVCDGTNWNII